MHYTRDQDIERMAIGALHILKGRALIDFPGTTVAHPSIFVVVSLGIHGALNDGYHGYFPFKVPWELWDGVMAHVILKGVSGLGLDVQVQRLKKSIGDRLIEKGYRTGSVNNVASLMDIDGGIPTDIYPKIDPQLAWIEGHEKLEYPVTTD